MTRGAASAALLALVACAPESSAPKARVPAKVETSQTLLTTAPVGTVAGTVAVKVTDATGAPLSGVVVTFTITLGGGTVTPSVDTTKADGVTAASFRVGTPPGANEMTALVSGFAPVKFAVTGIIGPTRKLLVTPRDVRLPFGRDSAVVTAVARDSLGNPTGDAITWTVADASVASVTSTSSSTALIRVLRRNDRTVVVVSSGVVRDTVRVTVQSAGFPCSFVAFSPETLRVGGVIAFEKPASGSNLACVHATDAGAEYALVVHYNTPVADIAVPIEITANGIIAPASAFPMMADAVPTAGAVAQRDAAFELALRQRERREVEGRVAGARSWYGSRLAAISAQVRQGDLLVLNTNALAFCDRPQLRTARVVAITNSAIVMADTSNPVGGFTDAEYREFGIAMDTLVNPVDTTAFGAPSDIDSNGKVGILFTKAVNQLTPSGSPTGVILGFYYSRDLLPKLSPFGNCPGSNVAEMFYLLVPDPNGTVNSNVRSKAFVQNASTATIGHEYQHLINASRRMFVNDAPQVIEEVWLNEGLSHIAEELLFYRASGGAPRQNANGTTLTAGTPLRALFDSYQRSNLARYREYLRAPESSSPLAADDRLATRGATWSFLRYLADRTRTTDGDFWRRLVNSKVTGTRNLDDALGGTITTASALSDWAVSVLADENLPNAASVFQQPSWDFVRALPAIGLSFGLVPRELTDLAPTRVTLQGGSSSYLRFAIPQNQEAIVEISGSGGAPLPPGMRLTIMRIK